MTEKPSYEELLARVTRLEESVARYSHLVDRASDLIHSVTPEGDFLYVNQAWREALGYSEEEIASLKLMDIVDDSCRNKCRKIFNCLIQGELVDRNETIFVAKDGRRLVVEGRCSTQFEGGRPVSMTGIFRDISERTRSEQALRESEERYRHLFENALDLIQIVRPDGQLLYVNKAWRQTFGYSEAEINNLSIFDLISPDCQGHCQATFSRVLSEDKVHSIETAFVAKDGRRIMIEGNAICKFVDGKPVSTQCILHDVTEKRKMEEELLKAQKLETVGVFAGGIAHDFNNLLQGVLGNISLAKLYVNPMDKAYARLEEIEKAAMRARSLTQQLLTFSKGGAPIKKTASIGELIRDSCCFALRGTNVRCEYELRPDLWPIEADEGQLSQVTQNLVINAAQAMPDGGVVTVRGANLEVGEHELYGLPAGRYVQISVEDQGIGIPAAHLAKIFDPYFSSKATGSGLGLAIAYSIISKHDGLITVDSEEGKGASFHIYLPASRAGVVPVRAVKTAPVTPVAPSRILVMDDEAMVRELAVEMLEALGCETVTVADGAAALASYQEAMAAGSPFDLVLMDLTIPAGMGGKEAMEKLRAIDPKVKAVVSSGYANDPIMANFRSYGFAGVVPKPYNVDELGRVLAGLLRRGNDGAP